MESETLVSITLPTKYGIDVYSSKIIDQYNFYIETLKESGIDIVLRYNDGEVDIFNINDLLEAMESSEDNTHYFLELYGRDFNSTNFKVFDMINEAYTQKYGYSVRDGPVYQKYNELFRKIKIVEKQISEIWKNFNEKSRVKIAQNFLEEKMNECYKLLNEPYKNNNKIVENLEYIMNDYARVRNEENEEKRKEEEIKQRREDLNRKKDMMIQKNNFGQFVYTKYNLVFDPKEKCVIGVANKMGGTYPLDLSGVQLCERLKLKYKVVNDQRIF